jgi:oligopeptide/dipeptide ABC transporter ATP-binding protein
MSEHLLTVQNLKTYFETSTGTAKAVDGVSFTVDAGKTMGIVGESGSGKSVTASSIMRLLPPNGRIVEGTIDFDGVDIMGLSKKQLVALRGNEIAMIFQDPMTSLDPVFKVGNQMVEMIRSHQDVSKEQARAMAIDALRRVGIPNPEKRMDAYPYELSGGMCQRVIIAMAICSQAKCIIADEPTTALDVTVQARVLGLLKELQQSLNTCILLITHNLGVVWEMCDDVMVMYAGKTVEKTSTKELYAEPLHPYTWGLLDSIPRLSDESKTMLNTIPGTPPDLRLTGSCCNFCNRCRYAQDICRSEVPPLIEVRPDHFVACHLQTATQTLERIKGEVE